jgi:hypothetical protein
LFLLKTIEEFSPLACHQGFFCVYERSIKWLEGKKINGSCLVFWLFLKAQLEYLSMLTSFQETWKKIRYWLKKENMVYVGKGIKLSKWISTQKKSFHFLMFRKRFFHDCYFWKESFRKKPSVIEEKIWFAWDWLMCFCCFTVSPEILTIRANKRVKQ